MTTDSTTPVTVTGLAGATAIDAGYAHTCAVLADATVRCWGMNFYGQLGDGTTSTSSSVPVAVTSLADVTTLAVGLVHTCALLADANVRCWGGNTDGELGDGTTTSSFSPVAVVGTGALAAGTHTVCVRATDSLANTSDGTACTTITVSKATQTITFVNPGAHTMLQSPLTVSATASSGLPVTFTTSTPLVCTAGGLNGATITLVRRGTCTIRADQSGNAIYSPAPRVSRSLTVS